MVGSKIHNYTRRTPALHYVIEAVKDDPQGNRFYMTANGGGVTAQDYILLKETTGTVKYQVERIEYYCGTPNYWIAQLVKCSS